MRYGLYLPNFGPFGYARTLADLARDAEQAGWDGFFIWDHIARPGSPDTVDPWIALAAIAMQTARLRIGALVTPLPRRRPWKVARETVSIDHLSGGRLVFGVGTGSRGGRRVEWEHFAEELNTRVRGAMLDEALAVLAGLWSGQAFSYTGQHYRAHDCHFLPAPLQSPRIPVWVAGYWPHRPPFRRAARWDGMVPLFGAPRTDALEQFKAVVQYVREQRTVNAPFDVAHVCGTPGDDRARAAAVVAPFAQAGATWWLEPISPDHFGGAWTAPWPLAAMRQRILQGPPRL